MDVCDAPARAVKKPSGTLRRSVASARSRPIDSAEAEEDMTAVVDFPAELNMQAFLQRMEDNRPEDRLDENPLDTADARGQSNRRKRLKKSHILKRIKRKHGFRIVTVTLLIVFLWLLWISA